MRQSDGGEILGPNDPRNIVIGIIHVTPGDDRQSVLTAITTQEKLGRDQIILDLPVQNRAFKTSFDFEGLRQMSSEIEAGLVLIVPRKSKIAALASKQSFTLYYSLDELVQAEFPPLQEDEEAFAPQDVPEAATNQMQARPSSATTPTAGLPVIPPATEGEEEAEQTQIFSLVPPSSATTPTAGLPVVPQEMENRDAEPLSVQQMVEMPEPSAAAFPVEIASPQAPIPGTMAEDEAPTNPSLVAVTPPTSGAAEEDEEPTDPSLAAVAAPDQPGAPVEPADPAQRGSYLPVPLAGTGSALVPSGAQPPVFYEPAEQHQRRSWRGLIITGIILLLLIGLVLLFNRPILDLIFPPTATVTITPRSQNVQHVYPIMAVLGVPDPGKGQVDARALYATSATQSQTVKASGQGHTSGEQAQGNLTFYNSSTSGQTIAAGTVIFDADGLAVVNNDTIELPGLDPSKGIVGVEDAAHTISAGSNQNIPANDLHNTPCCGGGIYVTNTAAFTGGQDAHTFTYVQQSDIDSVTQSQEAAQVPQTTAILKNQVRSNEVAAGSPNCAPLVKSNHQAGEQATTVTVSVTTTCVGEVYDMQAVQALAANELTQDAGKNPGAAYLPVGQIQTTVAKTVTDPHGNILLTVNAVGVWAYQFSSAQIKHLISLIAGKSSQDARTLLLNQPGVQNKNGVTITLTGVGVTTLPSDPNQISIDISAVNGLHN